jgi:hypothetical protein
MGDKNISERLKHLLEKRGEELAQGVSDEFELLHRELAALKREIAALANYQSSRGLVLEPPTAVVVPSLPKRVTIEADQLLRAHDGFYGVEHTSNGTPFRWTGPSVQFCFNVFVDRRNGADMYLLALTSIDFEIQKEMALIVDGETVPVSIEPDGAGFAVKAFLPPRGDHGATGLVFALPAVLVPPGGVDTRALGIAFARLSVAARKAGAAEMNEVPESTAAQ